LIDISNPILNIGNSTVESLLNENLNEEERNQICKTVVDKKVEEPPP